MRVFRGYPMVSPSKDIPASLVVFFVALPLCLGIALASGAPLLAGITTGVVGGIIAGALSGSHLAVSGPAAGLTVIVLSAIESVGFAAFLTAVALAGAMQIGLGVARAGAIGRLIPDSVIKGMLAAIGIILILKQIPHAVGYDAVPEGDTSFAQADGHTTFSELWDLGRHMEPGAIAIAFVGLAVLVLWELPALKKRLGSVPGPLVVVVLGAGLNVAFARFAPSLHLSGGHLVELPVFDSFSAVAAQISRPDIGAVFEFTVWKTALTIAAVASLETLLSLEATDKLDPQRRIAPANRELVAQGTGNVICGLIGGLPMTAVIVRSSANVAAGATSKMSAILHGVWLLLAVALVPHVVNRIPLAALAAILLAVGFELTRPGIYATVFKRGPAQFLPFIVTVAGILLTDLLIGILIGLAVGFVFTIMGTRR